MICCVTEGITAEQLAEVYADPYIQRLSHDYGAAAPITHPLVTYLSAWVDGDFAGAFMAIEYSDTETELHSLLLRRALKSSRPLGHACINWAFTDSPIVQRVTAYVFESMLTARNYCLRLGFRIEGFRRDAFSYNGAPEGVWVLGITRPEWEAMSWAR